MTDQLRDTVDELLDEAENRLADLPDFEAGDEDEASDALADADGLDDLAAEAGELIETTDSGELLDAVGLAELSDGSEPESIPEAISEGDPENVVELRSLLKLANLADREGDDRREGIDELRETIGDRSVDEIEETASSEDEEETDAVDDESRPDEADESAETEEDTETDEGDFTEQIRSAISGDLEGFRDELEQARDHFAELRDDDGAADGEDGETVEEGDDGEDEEDDDEGDDEDDGLFGTEEDSSGGRSTRHSTMAPPPSKRADMGRSTRHSTMPDRN